MFKFDTKTSSIIIETKFNKPRHIYMFGKLYEKNVASAFNYIKSFSESRGQIYSVTDYRSINKNFSDKILFKKKDSILKLYESMFDSTKNHTPNNTDLGQWLGVEIECMLPIDKFKGSDYECECGCDCTDDETCNYCNNGCQCEISELNNLKDYIKKQKIKYVSVKGDGSINADESYFGAELTVLFKRNDRSNLKKLCDVLNKLGAKVNKSCGMHVHFDQRDLLNETTYTKLKHRANNVGACPPFFSTLVPASRLNNTYCKLEVSDLNGNRYSAVNLTAYNKYKTIEVRLHSSTTDFQKITNWIDICLIAMYQKDKATSIISRLSDFCFVFDVPEHLITYMESRIEKFANIAVEEPNELIAERIGA